MVEILDFLDLIVAQIEQTRILGGLEIRNATDAILRENQFLETVQFSQPSIF
jgi:hypothetical protein